MSQRSCSICLYLCSKLKSWPCILNYTRLTFSEWLKMRSFNEVKGHNTCWGQKIKGHWCTVKLFPGRTCTSQVVSLRKQNKLATCTCICILREHFMQSLFLHKKLGRDGNLILAWTTEYWCCVYLINDYQVYRLKQIIFLFWNYFFLLELKIELLCYLWCFKACRTIFCNYWQFILQWKKKNITVYILQYRSILFGTIEFCQG